MEIVCFRVILSQRPFGFASITMKLSHASFEASRCPTMTSIGKDGYENVQKSAKKKSKRRTPRLTGVSKQRKMANERERRRVHTLNTHIESLRDLIPLSPCEKKLTKTEVIWMAAIYIGFLTELLEKTKNADDNQGESDDDVTQSLDLTFLDFSGRICCFVANP